MSRLKYFTVILLILLMIITNGTLVSYGEESGTGNTNMSGTTETVSGNASAEASGNASGDVVLEKENVTIFFYDQRELLKTVEIEKGSSVELWTPSRQYPDFIFQGWYIITEESNTLVTETTTFEKSTNLVAVFKRVGPVDPINYAEMYQQSLIARQLKQEQKAMERYKNYVNHIKIILKDVKKTEGNTIFLKVRSSSAATSPIEIQYSTSKKFKKSKTQTKIVKRSKNKSVKKFKKATLKKVKKNKTYYVRARAKVKHNGKTFYGKWSKVKKVKNS